jgi:5,5'-dehydrodivanillate O-demethylase oxygenase subunit
MNRNDNDKLTRVGPGTPMGEVLRRYWHPIAAVADLEDRPIKPVRLMGEDLVLYRDRSGHYGLLDRHCPHRRADLSYGYLEAPGLRCSYHGWLYDHTGRCRAQPYEDVANPGGGFEDRIRIKAYRVAAKAGMLWAYLGPDPAPLVPTWEPFTWRNGFVQIVYADVACNWLQCQENSCDPVHFEWLHANFEPGSRGDAAEYAPRHLRIDVEEFEWGLNYRRIREDTDERHPLWTIGRVGLHPNCLFTGDHFEWRVPVDDENTWSITWAFEKVPKEREPYVQERIPYWHGPVRDPSTGRWITSHVMNQDFVAWMGQGVIADRTKEHLGRSDRGVVLLRRRLMRDIERVGRGEDPSGLLRDPARNECIELPIIGANGYREGLSTAELEQRFARIGRRFPPAYIFQAGQPEAVRHEYEAAMGRAVSEYAARLNP